ncbi:MAG: putative Nudix hydrolase NudL [Nitrosopumilus sp.]|nr:putative Nudix hydrolase NudL [Nitrosopumilus sp.]
MNLFELKSRLSNDVIFETPIDGKFRLASILVIIYGDTPNLLMTKKPKHLKIHAGEISFPGGKFDNDSDFLETALRETYEEIGLTITREQVIGKLDPVITLNSGFLIFPFVTVLDTIPTLLANAEVEKILHIPLKAFLQTIARDPDPEHNKIQEMFTFEYQNQIVWGASARILKQIHDCVKS